MSPAPALAQDPGLEDAWQEPYTGMDFVRVPGGCFKMGCTGANCPADQVPAREVCVDAFYAARTEVTQGQWTRVMGQNPSEFKLGDNYPVERVSWNEAQNFLRRLGESSPGPFRFRLPTEAEWEYLCQRCPAPGSDKGSAKGKDAARNQARGRTTPRPAGSDEGVCQGVRDLSGNVAQWTADVYNKEAYTHLGKANPLNTSGGFDRVYRGACWVGSPDRISCRTRFHATPNTADPCLGLRVVMVPDKARAQDKAPDKAKGAAEARPTAMSGGGEPAGAEGPAGPNVLRQVLLKSGRDGLSVEFVAKNPVAGRTYMALLDPPRFVVDLAGQWTSEAALPRDGSVPEVKSVRLGAHPDKLRVVLDFTRSLNLAPRFVPTPTGLKVILTEPAGGGAATAAASGAEPAAEPQARAEAPKAGTGKTPPAAAQSKASQPGAPAEAAKSEPDDGPNVLKKISFTRENGRDVAEFSTERPVEEFVYFEADAPPPRLVVNLPGRWRSAAPEQVQAKDGPLSLVNAEVLPDRLRLTLTFRSKPQSRTQFHRTDSGLAVLLPESYEAPPGTETGQAKPGRTAPLVTPVAKAEPAPPPVPVQDRGGKAKPEAKTETKPEAKTGKPEPKGKAQAAAQPAQQAAEPSAPGQPEAAGSAPQAGEANTVETLRLNTEPSRTVAEVVASQPLGDFTYTRLDSPPRLVVTVAGAWTGEPKEAGSERGLVRRMATAVYPDKLMVTLTLSGKLEGRPVVQDLGRGLRITVEGAPGPAGAPGAAEEPGDQPGADVEKEALGRKPKAKGKEAGARVEEPAEAVVKPGSKADSKSEDKLGPKEEAKSAGQAEAQNAAAQNAAAKTAEDKARAQLEEKLKTQLFFSCTMSFASYQTLVWKEGEPKPAELAAKIAPYKQVFKEIALRKGSDEEAWTVLNSPVYDLGIELRRAGKAQSVCERINRLGPEQMDKLAGAAVKARNPEQVKGLVKQALTAPE